MSKSEKYAEEYAAGQYAYREGNLEMPASEVGFSEGFLDGWEDAKEVENQAICMLTKNEAIEDLSDIMEMADYTDANEYFAEIINEMLGENEISYNLAKTLVDHFKMNVTITPGYLTLQNNIFDYHEEDLEE